MANIKDVAKLACVSASTVSRTFSGRVNVDPETRRRILEAARQLNYEPNYLARSLKEGRSNTIGLVVPYFGTDIWPEIALGVEAEARRHGYLVILCNTNESVENETRYIRRLNGNCVDGFIIAPAKDNATTVRSLVNAGIPVVTVLRGREGESDAVHMNNYATAYTATDYLIRRGHKNILMVVGDTGIGLFQKRLEGYIAALNEHCIPQSPSLILSIISDFNQPYDAIREYFSQSRGVDAVLTSSDPQAISVIRVLKDMGCAIPGDISVMGIDDISVSKMIDPPLSTMAQPLDELGRVAVRKLLNRIEGDPPVGFTTDLLDATMIIRQSTR